MPGRIFAHMSASAAGFPDSQEDYREQHGWVDPDFSMFELFPSRNDVKTLISIDADAGHNEISDALYEALGYLPGGAEDNGDGTYTSYDVLSTGSWDYLYYVHFTYKHSGGSSTPYAEEPFKVSKYHLMEAQ
jgi:hypothetical protein